MAIGARGLTTTHAPSHVAPERDFEVGLAMTRRRNLADLIAKGEILMIVHAYSFHVPVGIITIGNGYHTGRQTDQVHGVSAEAGMCAH